MIDGQKRGFMQFQDIRAFLDSILDEDIHTKRVDSLANATLGVMTGASLGVALIGKSLAQARGLLPKHAVKQVDRLLSNRKLEAWDIFATWVPELVGSRTDLIVAMDWTDYDADGQATLALKLVTRHGRATPLVWLSVLKDELKDARNDCEDACLRRLAEVLPAKVRATILADRGFADTKLFEFLGKLEQTPERQARQIPLKKPHLRREASRHPALDQFAQGAIARLLGITEQHHARNIQGKTTHFA